VRAGAAKLTKMLAAKQQGRLDGFFTVKPKEGAASTAPAKKGEKRKAEEKGGAKKKGKK
jgi:flap endonuclease-1